MNFMNIGSLELMVIIAIAILAVGPKRMVEVARTIGRLAARMRSISGEFTSILRSEFSELDEARQEVQAAVGEFTGKPGEQAAASDVADAVEETQAEADESMQSLLEDGLGLRQIASELQTTATEARQFVERASKEEEAEDAAELAMATGLAGDDAPPPPGEEPPDEAGSQPAGPDEEADTSGSAAAPPGEGIAESDRGDTSEPEHATDDGVAPEEAAGADVPAPSVAIAVEATELSTEAAVADQEGKVTGQVIAAPDAEGDEVEDDPADGAPDAAAPIDQTDHDPGLETTGTEGSSRDRPVQSTDPEVLVPSGDAPNDTLGQGAAGTEDANQEDVENDSRAATVVAVVEPPSPAVDSDTKVGPDEV